MQMNVVLTWAVFAAALVTALLWGVRAAFVFVYLPAVMMFSQVATVVLQHAPVSPTTAPIYAILLAMPFTKESLRFRLCSVDVVALLLLLGLLIAWFTDQFEPGINAARNEALRLTGPYFIARIAFQDWQVRRKALWVMVGITGVITMLALIEFRLFPYFYQHWLTNLGLGNTQHEMALARHGFFRVSATVEHPISFGNTFLAVLCMLAVLARTSGVRLTNPWVAAAVAGATLCVFVSLSYTPYLGLIAGVAVLAVLRTVPWSRRLVLPLTLLVVVGLTAYTYKVAVEPLSEAGHGVDGVEGSLYVRHLIIKRTWALATSAGPFGYGVMTNFSGMEDFDLDSVDNSYMGLAMTRGWVGVGLWVMLGVCFAARVTKAFGASGDPSLVFPLAVATAGVLGLMMAMYTVWAGAFYSIPWFILMALSNSLIDQVMAVAQGRPASPGVGPLRPPTVRLRGGLAGA